MKHARKKIESLSRDREMTQMLETLYREFNCLLKINFDFKILLLFSEESQRWNK